MAMVYQCGKENLNPGNIISYMKYKIEFQREHPFYFDPDGLLCFIGPQGSGKTLSAVNYVYNLIQEYPNVKLCTNLMLKDYPVVTFEEFVTQKSSYCDYMKSKGTTEQEINKALYSLYLKENQVFPFLNNDDFNRYDNDEYGIIFLVDEIHLYLNSLESKNVNMDTMAVISQQRKGRMHIVTTCQVFGRMAKPLREQFSHVIVCKNILGFLQRNSLVDRDSINSESSSDTNIKGTVKRNFMWFHNPEMYKRYDTYYIIEKGKFVSGEKQKEGVYDVGKLELSINN